MRKILAIILLSLASLALCQSNKTYPIDSTLELARTTDNPEWRIMYLNTAAWTFFTERQDIDSLFYYSDLAMSLNRVDLYPAEIGRSYFNKGSGYAFLGDYEKSVVMLQKAVDFAEIGQDTLLIIQSYGSMGVNYSFMNEHEKSIRATEKSIDFSEIQKDTFGIIYGLNTLGSEYIELKKYDLAEQAFFAMKELSEIKKRSNLIGYANGGLGRLNQHQHNTEKSLFFFEEMRKNFDYNLPTQMAQNYHDNLAFNYKDLEQYELAMEHCDTSLALAKQMQFANSIIDLTYLKRDLFALTNQWDSAYVYSLKYFELKDSIHSIDVEATIADIDAKYEIEKKEKDLALAAVALNDQEKISEEGEEKFNKLIMITALILIVLLTVVILFIQRRTASKALKDKNTIIEGNLKEKELLLGEIHHRVKNNLQLVSTMLELQSKHDQDPKFAGLVKESCLRIQTMSLIHQVLYQYDDLAGIGMDKYLRNLISKLHTAYSSQNVKTVFDIEDITIGIDTAIPLALVVNEIYTNSLKYAFEKEGVVTISLSDKEEYLELQITDDGKGFEKDQVIENFGSKLVKSFSRQLDATVEIISKLGEGTSTLIKINRFERV